MSKILLETNDLKKNYDHFDGSVTFLKILILR